MKRKIFVFGNEDLKEDNLPLRILPELRKRFSEIEFEIKDPNEELFEDVYTGVYTNVLTILDTVVGIKNVKIFDNLEKFSSAPRVSMHDFDALASLRFLQKIGKIKKAIVIGVPQELDEKEALIKVAKVLKIKSKKE